MFLKRWHRKVDHDLRHYLCTYWDASKDCTWRTHDCRWTRRCDECMWSHSDIFRKMRNAKFLRGNIIEMVVHFFSMLLSMRDGKWPLLVTPWRPRLMIKGIVFTGEYIYHSTCEIFLLDSCLNGAFSTFRTIFKKHNRRLITRGYHKSDNGVVSVQNRQLSYFPNE